MLGRIVAVAVVASLAVAPFAFATEPVKPRPAQVDVTGLYHSNYEDVRLVQNGDRVRGTYVCCGGGTIEGRIIDGRTIRYVWRQPSAWGLGVWTIKSGKLEGTWGSEQDEVSGGRWDLERAARKSQIAN